MSEPKKLTSKEKEYFASGAFVHDELLRRAGLAVETARTLWRKNHKVDPNIVILWPSEPVKTVEGPPIEDEILAEYPTTDTFPRLRQLVDMTKAYGLLIIELRPDALHAMFETHHGARSWLMKIERHGDVDVLKNAVVRDNADHLGLLWSASRGTA